MIVAEKNWDSHVNHAEEVARSAGFGVLRDRILDWAEPGRDEVALDVGAGTGLLSLALAPCVREVWAIDISPSMADYLSVKAASAGLDDVRVGVGSAVSLPLVDASVDLAVSNYCFHHLRNDGKRRALAEVHRVLRPGGRLVFADMMFGIGLADRRDRQVVAKKLRQLGARGPAGVSRIARNGARLALRRWEHPVRAEWWREALTSSGFVDVAVELLEHEGGMARATRP